MDDGRNTEYRTRNIECRSEKIKGRGEGVYWPHEKVRHLKGCGTMADG